jgi:hypothetical protein
MTSNTPRDVVLGETQSGNMQPWQPSEQPESHALSTSNHDALGISVFSPEVNNWLDNNSTAQHTGEAIDTFASTAWSNTPPNNTSRPQAYQEATFNSSAGGWGSLEPEHRSPTNTCWLGQSSPSRDCIWLIRRWQGLSSRRCWLGQSSPTGSFVSTAIRCHACSISVPLPRSCP